MASLYQPVRAFPLPPDAPVVTRAGVRYARLPGADGRTALFKLSRDGTQYLRRSKVWHGKFRDHLGLLRTPKLSANKDAARLLLAERLRAVELARAGVTDPAGDHRRTPLARHAEDYLAVVQARGRTPGYVALLRFRLGEVLAGGRFVLSADLLPDRLERYLGTLTAAGKSTQTRNDYLAAVKQLVNWMVAAGRLDRDPFGTVRRNNAQADRRRIHLVPELAELRALVAAAHASGTVFRKLTGPDRAVLYRLAMSTGYRADELAALTPECFALVADPPAVGLGARDTKNGGAADQAVPEELAADLRTYLRGKPAGVPVWPSTWSEWGADMIRADAAAAGLTLRRDSKDGRLVLTFHSLRGAYAMLLGGLGLGVKELQSHGRWSNAGLPLHYQNRPKLAQMGRDVNRLPSLAPNPPPHSAEPMVLRAAGTDGRPDPGAGAVPDAVAPGAGGGG